MRIESTGFTRADVEGFLDEMLDHDRNLLADRLERLETGEMIGADEIARLPLVNHLEMHVDQLERALEA